MKGLRFGRRVRAGRAMLAAGGLVLVATTCAAAAGDVAYVSSLAGKAEMQVAKERSELFFLDLLPEGSRLTVSDKAQLRICHHASGRVTTIVGPASVVLTANDVISEGGRGPEKTEDRCLAPVVSKVQGGTAFRSAAAPKPGSVLEVNPRSWVKVVSDRKSAVRKTTISGPGGTGKVAEFRTISDTPLFLNPGETYPVKVDLADGRSFAVSLKASPAVESDVVMIDVAR